jgi:hypothetical protein
MFIDHKKIHAAASASFCVRSSMGALLLCCGLAGAFHGTAHADPGDGPRRDDNRGQPTQQNNAPRQSDQRQSDQQRQVDQRNSYEARAEEQRRAMQEASRNAEMNRRVGRLTPDERRDLRRQINEVGQDIYANPPRR